MLKTVGELKEFIKDLLDDMLLVNYECNMERSGYFNRLFCNVEKMKEYSTIAYDSFDGTPYSYNTLEISESGIECLRFS